MKLGVVGGALQGTEIAYLAKMAGIRTLIIDKRSTFPALPLADEIAVFDVRKEQKEARYALEGCDAVIPANEDISTLRSLVKICSGMSSPLLFDEASYSVTSSKVRTNDLMRELGTPMPADWPDCGYPVVVKPSGSSGSHGVSKVRNKKEMNAALQNARMYDSEMVVQEFIEGPNVSIELIGTGADAMTFKTTEIVLDENYDCKMVLCPPESDVCDEKAFAKTGKSLASALHLKGIMDVEAIVHNGVPKVLELDARFPSQTPITVYHSTGINLLTVLLECYVTDGVPVEKHSKDRYAIFEHVRCKDGVLESYGEAMMAESQGLRLSDDFYGADSALTDMTVPEGEWRATLVNTGKGKDDAWNKRDRCISKIMESCGCGSRYDSSPGRCRQ